MSIIQDTSKIYPTGVEVIQGSFLVSTTTAGGVNTILYDIDILKNQVIHLKAEAHCGKVGVDGHAVRFASRSMSYNGGVYTLSASSGPDPAITASFNNPVLAITPSPTQFIILTQNTTQDTDWVVLWTLTMFELP